MCAPASPTAVTPLQRHFDGHAPCRRHGGADLVGVGQPQGRCRGYQGIANTTATDTDSTGCGGTVANNNNFGEGRLNAFRAVSNAPRGPTGTLTGRVTDSLSGEALAGATVVATGPASASATTNASGVYSIVVPAGTYSVTASLTLYQSGTVTGVVVPANGTARPRTSCCAPTSAR